MEQRLQWEEIKRNGRKDHTCKENKGREIGSRKCLWGTGYAVTLPFYFVEPKLPNKFTYVYLYMHALKLVHFPSKCSGVDPQKSLQMLHTANVKPGSSVPYTLLSDNTWQMQLGGVLIGCKVSGGFQLITVGGYANKDGQCTVAGVCSTESSPHGKS